jgi:broad specificity phosphatase PhoE
MARCLVLRHGKSLANERGLIASSPAQASAAFGLTPEGRLQVAQTVTRALEGGVIVEPVTLATSPLLRALESARVAGDLIGCEALVDDRLIERGFGDLELSTDDQYARVWERDGRDPSHRCWGVESVEDVLRRAGAFVDELARDQADGTILLCTHGDVASALLCASRGRSLAEHRDVGGLGTGALGELHSLDLLREALRGFGQ